MTKSSNWDKQLFFLNAFVVKQRHPVEGRKTHWSLSVEKKWQIILD